MENMVDRTDATGILGVSLHFLERYILRSHSDIDGIVSIGEWHNKVSITLNGYNNPILTKTGDLYIIMNDNSNIYIAVIIPDIKQDLDYLMVDFDRDNNQQLRKRAEQLSGADKSGEWQFSHECASGTDIGFGNG